jgi:hypothetical protein
MSRSGRKSDLKRIQRLTNRSAVNEQFQAFARHDADRAVEETRDNLFERTIFIDLF